MTPSTRSLVLRWSAAGLVLPAALGVLSWLAYAAGLGYLSEAFAFPALFAAPLSPFVMKAFMGREVHGVEPYLVAAAVAASNVLIYGLLGMLHARLSGAPPVNRWLWLTLAIGAGFFVLDFIASILAFA